MGDFIGPALPLHLRQQGAEADRGDDSPASRVPGPTLPPHLSSGSGNSSERTETTECGGSSSNDNDADLDSEEGDAGLYGPALPPGLVAGSRDRVLGPALPQGFRRGGGSSSGDDSSSSDEEVVGPLPPSSGGGRAHEALERRARALKRKFDGQADGGEQDGLKRESWMLELPPDRAKEFGLGPRQFRRREAQEAGDRSVWTDTPEDKINKKPSRKDETVSEMQKIAINARDTQMEKLVEKHGKGRDKEKSLLEKHQDELKKKKQKTDDEGKPKERRPFDRNVDLQANRFDEAQKKSIFKKAQLLNDRFSRGESKFL
ncbi:GPALPP motifs-containing protein 1 isoform X2 [Bacillus rossius redtenbacheri]